jgi:hypothetical protein
LTDGELHNVRITDYGIQYHIYILVKGLNGASKTVRTAWITRDDITISLTTAYIAEKAHQQNIEGEEPFIVKESDPSTYWEALYELAFNEACRASSRVILTPMYVAGWPEPITDGECGLGYVVIQDARKGFAKWLKSSSIGHLGYKGGWEVFASTQDQSLEKAKVYVETFAKIPCQNGVKCYSVSRPD